MFVEPEGCISYMQRECREDEVAPRTTCQEPRMPKVHSAGSLKADTETCVKARGQSARLEGLAEGYNYARTSTKQSTTQDKAQDKTRMCGPSASRWAADDENENEDGESHVCTSRNYVRTIAVNTEVLKEQESESEVNGE